MKKITILLLLSFFQLNAYCEVIRVNCASKVIDYSFVVVVDTVKNTVSLNDNADMKNVRISQSNIYFEMDLADKSKGDYFMHSINRVTGILSLQIIPNGNLEYYQCSKIQANKF
jgi:hypothetical protein